MLPDCLLQQLMGSYTLPCIDYDDGATCPRVDHQNEQTQRWYVINLTNQGIRQHHAPTSIMTEHGGSNDIDLSYAIYEATNSPELSDRKSCHQLFIKGHWS